MYLHTRLLLGILGVTLVALAVSVLVPLASLRQDVSRETGASLQLASLLLDVQAAVRDSEDPPAARLAVSRQLRQAGHLRHVSLTLLGPDGTAVASTPNDTPPGGALARVLLPPDPGRTLSYPLSFRGEPLGTLRVHANPLSEFEELEERITSDMALLALAILVMAVSIYAMVRRGLRPVGQIKDALTRLADGELGTRLPHFRLRDLDEICDRFNHCAGALEEAAAARHELSRRLMHVAEAERTHLARELHDELGQSLTAIKVDAAYIAREAGRAQPQIESCARGIETVAGEVMLLIRGMLARLKPHNLETFGLRESLRELIASWEARMAERFSCSLVMTEAVDALAPEVNIALYRLVQECLTNAVRHSRARNVAIRLSAETQGDAQFAPRVWLRVQESGGEAPGDPMSEGGMGLLGMRERVEAHGGELRIVREPQGGLTLEAWMPIGTAATEDAGG